MGKERILNLVKRDKQFENVRLPDHIDWDFDEPGKTISMKIKYPCKNMQTDDAAFEGWILCIKSALPGEVSHFALSWEKCPRLDQDKGDAVAPDAASYMRFLLRVEKFVKYFADLVAIDAAAMAGELDRLPTRDGRPLTINSPSGEEDRGKLPANRTEACMEREIVSRKNDLAAALGVDFTHLDNQFPVGLFSGEPSRTTRVTPGGKSAIDIWGVDKSGAAHVFELKKGGEKRVGIISELMFYAYVIADIQSGCIKCDEKHNGMADAIHKASHGKPNVKAHFLVPDLHPFITKRTIDIINAGLAGAGISFDAWAYTFTFTPYFGAGKPYQPG